MNVKKLREYFDTVSKSHLNNIIKEVESHDFEGPTIEEMRFDVIDLFSSINKNEIEITNLKDTEIKNDTDLGICYSLAS